MKEYVEVLVSNHMSFFEYRCLSLNNGTRELKFNKMFSFI
jgi:hypothetical protein